MPSQPSGPVRRSQLIAPFGPGAMVTVPGGTSVIIAGLDYWFPGSDENLDRRDFELGEWRLEQRLEVDSFRLPPDYRTPYHGEQVKNVGITIPTFRFPQWHFCSQCKLLMPVGMFTRGRVKCPDCEEKGRTRYMSQVPFVAMCTHGHLQDFPWREWVHRDPNPSCDGTLRLTSTGRATLAGQYVECDKCLAKRSLAGITSGEGGSTVLSSTLSQNQLYLCRGSRPWLGPESDEPCGAPIRGSLRSASNVYFANVVSSLYLPRSEEESVQEIIGKLEEPQIDALVQLMKDIQGVPDTSLIVRALLSQYPEHFGQHPAIRIAKAVDTVISTESTDTGAPGYTWSTENSFRRSEFEVLKRDKNDQLLRIREADLSQYAPNIAAYFSRITLVEKLRETRVLAGFSRVFPDSEEELSRQQSILWRNLPERGERWLPAYTVFGEGIFFELNEERLRRWETTRQVEDRIQPLLKRIPNLRLISRLGKDDITPRFIAIHTFSHLLMNQLTFECGYSSASLRERLYVSSDPITPMAGLLVYTAAGDSEGTMGGLVRMGKPGHLEPVICKALAQARWCSSDPVCMEMGRQGQGPDSCNLAACHNCALVPETACEQFNRFLDRGLVVGEIGDPEIGLFSI